METTIWWVRRDLRLHENPALQAALQASDQVLPVFILDPKLLSSRYVGEKRRAFLFAGLQALKADLQAHGTDLVIRRGDPRQALSDLNREVGAVEIFAQEDFSPYARARDRRVGEELPLRLTPGEVVHHPRLVLKDDGTPYTVYTPFSKKWRTLQLPDLLPPVPDQIPAPAGVLSEPVPGSDVSSLLPAGEQVALEMLRTFTHGENPPVFEYAETRNRVDLAGTSGLSPYLRFGMLSPRLAVQAAIEASQQARTKAAMKGAEVWLNELIWREFFVAILFHFPDVRQASFQKVYQQIEWANNEADFEAWCAGRTGFPLVDAAMRQLTQTGWMHNRARMVVASFLTKDLLIDWRWGEQWFMEHLIDGDPAANNGGWQWTAGTGTDAAPYFRIFSPISQSQKHDPDGAYIRHYVPELVGVPGAYIYEPWKMPPEVQSDANCIMGQDYPAPIVDRRWARERTLAAYKKARE
jgi:deoxyribodipyrimidine photo-lyase